MNHKADLLIIGAGPVGLFSVYQAGFLGMKTIVVDALKDVGGQLSALYPHKFIYDIPAFKEVLAKDLVTNLQEQANQFPTTYLMERLVNTLHINEDKTFQVTTSTQDIITCKAIIIAAGAGAFVPNRPPFANVTEFENKSIHYFVKDPQIFKGKELVIAGGGDSAVDWALALYDITEKIYVVHRRDHFRAAPSNVAKLKELAKTKKLELVIPYMLDGLEGEKGQLAKVLLKTLDGEKKVIKANSMLALFGLARSLGSLEQWGFNVNKLHASIDVNPVSYETKIPRIFAVGDVAQYDHKLKLILVGFSEAAVAIHSSWKYVFPDKPFHFVHSTTKN
ncbi:Ferredoxin--NADP reductase 2 [Candidatus Hepatincola sp. Av]